MTITIEVEMKEIAALVSQLQERHVDRIFVTRDKRADLVQTITEVLQGKTPEEIQSQPPAAT